MQIVNLYLRKEMTDIFKTDSWSKYPIFKTIEVNENEDLWEKPLLINGKFYYAIARQENSYAISEMKYYKLDTDIEDLEEYDDEIKCPVCGFKESDCYEYDNEEEDEHECHGCGSILSWSREYTVTYTTTVNKIQPALKFD